MLPPPSLEFLVRQGDLRALLAGVPQQKGVYERSFVWHAIYCSCMISDVSGSGGGSGSGVGGGGNKEGQGAAPPC